MISRRGFITATAAAAGGLALAAPAAHAATALAGTHRTLPSGRTYWLSGAGDRLVLGLHGTGLTAANCNDTFWVTGHAGATGWQWHAAQAGYRLALCEAAAGNWDVGGAWPGGTQDDLGYLADVAADAGGGTEVFAAGFSSGGAMAWRAVCQRPDVFAAAGSASGWAGVQPTAPVDVWHVHGTADTTVPVRGGPGTLGVVFPPAYQEAARAPRGSRVVLEPMPGGHATPGWMAGRVWGFWTTGR